MPNSSNPSCIPPELLIDIVTYVASPDLWACSVATVGLNAISTPKLYSHVSIDTLHAWRGLVGTLTANTRLADLVVTIDVDIDAEPQRQDYYAGYWTANRLPKLPNCVWIRVDACVQFTQVKNFSACIPFEEICMWAWSCPNLKTLSMHNVFSESIENLGQARALDIRQHCRRRDTSWPRDVELVMFECRFGEDDPLVPEFWAMCESWITKVSLVPVWDFWFVRDECGDRWPRYIFEGVEAMSGLMHVSLHGHEYLYGDMDYGGFWELFPSVRHLRRPWQNSSRPDTPLIHLVELELSFFNAHFPIAATHDCLNNTPERALQFLKLDISQDKFPSLASLKLYGPRKEWMSDVRACDHSTDSGALEAAFWGYHAIERAVLSTGLDEECRRRSISLLVFDRDTRGIPQKKYKWGVSASESL
jgi:hypothetical protein